jgi:hypothetical protein
MDILTAFSILKPWGRGFLRIFLPLSQAMAVCVPLFNPTGLDLLQVVPLVIRTIARPTDEDRRQRTRRERRRLA